jgi:predicted glycosyltransferase
MMTVANALPSTCQPVWLLRDKDQLLQVAEHLNLRYRTFSTAGRGLLGNAWELLCATAAAVRFTRNRNIDCWFTKYAAGNIAAWCCGRTSLSFNDDDYDVVPFIAYSSYPFATRLLAPTVTRMGRFAAKTIRYNGYHELFYLHPKRFTPDPAIYSELGISSATPYAIVRLSALVAHHDRGVRGLDAATLERVLLTLQSRMRVFITSEKPLGGKLAQYHLALAPHRIHHALAQAELFVGDSQTMTAEAAVLGVPAFQVSDFAGRISYINELKGYGLAFTFRPGETDSLIRQLECTCRLEHRKNVFRSRRDDMIRDKADPLPIAMNALLEIVGECQSDFALVD